MRQIVFAGEEAQERTALLRDLVTDRPTQHRVVGFQRIEDRPLGDGSCNVERHFAADVCQRSQVWRKYDADHSQDFFLLGFGFNVLAYS